MSPAFEMLIAPVPKEEFFHRIWGKEYLISSGSRDRFASLFSWDVLSEILSTHRFDFPRLRLLSGGRVAPPAQYIVRKVDRRGNPYMTHDAEAVARLLGDGAMLHITSIGETWKPLATFAAQLEPVLGGRVQVNLHAGLARSRGFHTHWDGHDVYAAQIDGCKEWRLFGVTEEHPLAVPPEAKHGAPASHTWEGTLGTGQVLYLPRGYWHATQFLDRPSLHLTFAVQHPTGLEFGHWLVDQLAESTFARSDVPLPIFELSTAPEDTKSYYIGQMQDVMSRLVTPESLEKFVRTYRATLGRTKHLQLSPTKQE